MSGQAFRALLVSRPGRPYIGAMTERHETIAEGPKAPPVAYARFSIGEVVRHRLFDFRGVIFDIDPVFANSEEWYQAIPPDVRPAKDQPFYHLLAENAESSYIAYVSQQNLEVDEALEPIDHPAIAGLFDRFADGRYLLKRQHRH
jgi:heat shock protein HspQ